MKWETMKLLNCLKRVCTGSLCSRISLKHVKVGGIFIVFCMIYSNNTIVQENAQQVRILQRQVKCFLSSTKQLLFILF